MKKVIYLLVLCMVLGMAGCGTNQENKEPVSGNVSVEIENKENDDVVQILAHILHVLWLMVLYIKTQDM